jgi:catalase
LILTGRFSRFDAESIFRELKTHPSYAELPLKISGDADRYDQKRGVDDDYIQPGNLFRLLPTDELKRLIQNITNSLKKIPKEFQKKMVAHFRKADQGYGDGVAKGLRL